MIRIPFEFVYTNSKFEILKKELQKIFDLENNYSIVLFLENNKDERYNYILKFGFENISVIYST
jgi:hypothetical protein